MNSSSFWKNDKISKILWIQPNYKISSEFFFNMKNLKIVGIQVKKKFFECLSRLRVKKRTLSISPGPISQSVMFVAQEKKSSQDQAISQPARRDHDFSEIV